MTRGRAALSLLVCLLAGFAPAAGDAAGPPKVYVGLFKDDAVAVIDSATLQVLRTIPVPKGPHGLVVTPDGAKVYVSSDGASTVSVIDTATDRVVGTIEVGPNPHGLAMAPDGRRVLVSGWGANQAIVIDTASDRVAGRVPVAQAHNGALGRDGRTAWVGSQQQGALALVRIDLEKMAEVSRVQLDKTPRALDLSPDGSRLYFTVAGTAAVLVLDTATGQVVAQVPVGASPHHSPLTPDGRWALVPSQGPGELGIVDTGAAQVAATVPVGKIPHWATSSSDGRVAYVTNEGSNDVSVVDLARRAVIATIPVGNAPRKIAMQPGPVPRAGAAPPATTAAAPRQRTIDGVVYTDQGTRDVRDAAELVLRADDYSFTPTFLRGRPGQRLRVRVENAATTLHNLSVAGLSTDGSGGRGVDRDLPPGARVDMVLAFPATGATRFYCKFHSPLGQNGQLLAER